MLKCNFNKKNTFCQLFFSKSSIQQISLKTFNENCVFDQSWHCFPSMNGDILPPTEGSLRDRIIINKDGIIQDLLYNSLKKIIREKGNSKLRICKISFRHHFRFLLLLFHFRFLHHFLCPYFFLCL